MAELTIIEPGRRERHYWTELTGLAEASSSLISNANLIGKVSVSQPFSSGSASAVSEKWKAASPT
jgi:hypothetical protein